MTYLLGIDLGTSSIRSMIFNTQNKKEYIGQAEYQFDIPKFGWAEQNPEIWWKAFVKSFVQALDKANIKPSQIEALSFSGQMHGLILLNKEFQVLRPAILWCDQRTAQITKQINSDAQNLEFFERHTSNKLYTGFALASLLWVKQNEPENYSDIKVILSPKDWLRYKLCGMISTEVTDAAASLMFDVKAETWSDAILEKFGLPKDIFPPVYQPTDFAGNIKTSICSNLGFSPKCKVFHGGADQVMQAIGNGIVEQNIVSVTIGTGGQVLSLLPSAETHPNLNAHIFNYALPHTHYFMGATLSAGLALRWLNDNILQKKSYIEMDKEAGQVPIGSEGLIFLPYLMGERTPHSDLYAKGAYFGLNIKHDRKHLIRSLLEGVVFSLKDSLDTLTELNVNPDYIVASGGGAQSEIWLQIQADILGLPIYVSKSSEQASIGAVITAAVGANIYDDYAEACRDIVSWQSNSWNPIPDHVKKYEETYMLFQEIYKLSKKIK